MKALLGVALFLGLCSTASRVEACSVVALTDRQLFRGSDAVVVVRVTSQVLSPLNEETGRRSGLAEAVVEESLKGSLNRGSKISYPVNFADGRGADCPINTLTAVGGRYRLYLDRIDDIWHPTSNSVELKPRNRR